ncbi:pogo transposable element with KRAB domain-like [Brachionus plicatilis]|uniref:Pogo transposable element with KRAB domain-like n=1 Tax=Brachionus plicatilis TaxID=10195 RepID=A0A3M7Q7N2_BRAPC|nr:pogo transposable element with KRAB domain-like [Brachionus plicatilis]
MMYKPPRMTNILQPANVSWFGALKKEYHTRWNKWLLEEERTYTRFGNAKSPGYAVCIRWLSEIWSNFNSAVITSSFNDLDESDDIDGFVNEDQLFNCNL